MEARASISPAEFEALVERSRLIVSHAGIGTVLTAQRFSRPILLFPRRFEHGEHRNDHQVATVRHLAGRPGLLIALDEAELEARIAQGLAMEGGKAKLSPTAKQLRHAIVGFIETGRL
jgi:UDP-N-acetylglucosamine transferase subunit ALG13